MIARDAAIAVIGAGPSGLSFAAKMARHGFSRVTVFERDERAGGKCCTVELDGRAHDLGATMGVPGDYDRVLALGRGIANERFPVERHYSIETGGPISLNRWHELPRVLYEAARYFALHAFVWRLDGSGLEHAPPELHASWAEVVARRGLSAVSRRTLCYRAGYGYGFDDDVPAVMYANLFRPKTFLGLLRKPAFVWRGGTQAIWENLARRLDVRTATEIEQIERTGDGIRLRFAGERRVFGALVLAIDPRDALSILDASADERRWFSDVRSLPYATFACSVDHLDTGRSSVGYIDENMVKARAGHPMAWVKRYADHDVFVFHLFAPDSLSDGDVTARIAGDIARLGGKLRAVRAIRRWRFFPHFSTEFMRAGGLGEIARWQGRTRTWLIGEALSFATLSRVTEHAEHLADALAAPSAVLSSSIPAVETRGARRWA